MTTQKKALTLVALNFQNGHSFKIQLQIPQSTVDRKLEKLVFINSIKIQF